MNPMCQFFEPDDTFEPNGVSSDGHEAEDHLSFFWPLPGGGALRVFVCHRHADLLTEMAARLDGKERSGEN